MLDKIFKELDLSPLAQKIFDELIERGPSTARHLAEKLDIPRPSVYDHIKALIQRGFVTERTEENKKIFCVDNISHIPDLLQNKIESLQSEKGESEAKPVRGNRWRTPA